jgi:pseudaminic acid synthase
MKSSFKKNKCFIIAEVSANHGQKLERAVQMIRVAKQCGADAVKFQTYTPDTLTMDSAKKYFQVKHAQWGGQTLYELYKQAYTPWDWFKALKRVADSEGITFFSAAFDPTAVDLLEALKVPIHKVASFELVDIPLIEYAAKTGKPLIMSTGLATVKEIAEAVRAARRSGAKDLTLLKCVSSYPAPDADMHLRTIPDMKTRFNCDIGLSDHSLGTTAAVAAVCMGAKVVEKHFTLSRKLKTADSFFSIEPDELKQMVEEIRRVEEMLGQVHYGLTTQEKKTRIFRRSLFVTQDIQKGEILTKDNVRSIRPAHGLEPKYLSKVIGKKSARAVPKGTPLSLNMVRSKT